MSTIEIIKNVALILGVVDFLVYVTYIFGKYGPQSSISISFYNLPEKYGYVFRIYIWLLSLAIIIGGFGWNTPLFTVSGLLLSLVGFFVRIKTTWKYMIHLIGAIGGILMCLIGVFDINISYGILMSIVITLESLMFYLFGNRKYIIWNIECICFGNLISILFYLTWTVEINKLLNFI